jgi:hypothetical protein
MRYYWFLLLLAGCTASNWTKEGATTADLDRDYDECRDIGKLDTATAAVAGVFGAVGVFVGSSVKDAKIRSCLQARGWAVGPVEAKLAEPAETPAAKRLRELKALSDQGLITKQEYEEKRQAILGGL